RLLEVRRPGGRTLHSHSPLLRRDDAPAGLTSTLEQVREARSAQLVTVLGAPGVGKSRLTHEFVSTLRGQPTVLSGRCLPYGRGITFWPIAEVIKQACGISDEDTVYESRTKIAEALPPGEERASIGP